ncbi:MAG: hypothetical protein AAGA58_04520 [Verrucomicrobiota bacterium]
MIWDGSNVLQQFFTPEVCTGGLGDVAIAEKPSGEIAVATWQTRTENDVRTFDLLYMEGPRPFPSSLT